MPYRPDATGGVYVNFVSEHEGEESLGYGDNYERLAALKARYDPENLFGTTGTVAPRTEAD